MMHDPPHMMFDGQIGSSSRNHSNDVGHVHLDFDTLLSADHISSAFGSFEPCTHDDSCLHFTQFQKPQDKLSQNFAQTPPATSSLTFGRTQKPSSRKDHNRRKGQVDHIDQIDPPRPSSTEHSHDYSWDHFFGDSALAGCHFYTADADETGHCPDDDCVSMSCSSACEGSCPSQCGETSHGVCCADDACENSRLCMDEDCPMESQACTDENCVVDPCIQTPHISTSPSLSDGDKAAAAALASFGSSQCHNHVLQGAYMQQPLSQAPARDGTLSFMNLPNSLPCGSLSMDSILSNLNGHPSFPNQPYQMAFEYALASHIMQFHDPAHGLAQHGSCVANDPGQLITKCTLPKYNPHDLANTDPFLPQIQTHECGFPIQDPNEFAHHIFQVHRPNLMIHAHQYAFSGLSHSHHNQSAGHSDHQDGTDPYFTCSLAEENSKHFSPSMSPLTNLSMGPSLAATPVSLPTPSTLESELPLTDAPTLAQTLSSSTEAISQVKAQQGDEFLCRWSMRHGNAICGQTFENDEQLQKHCKHDHLKHLKKFNGGFRCGWANCTRNTCFTQRSKVERHMQVHTGYKPVQCTICGTALSAKQALDQHMRIHTGETPWVCKFPGCGCAFKQQSALTMHERTHTGDKPLECEVCGKRFSESSNLSKHRRTHNVKGMHECQLCGKDFHRLDQLRRHMGTNHKDRLAEVDALLSESKGKKTTAHKVSKLKNVKAKTREGKIKGKTALGLDDCAGMDMTGESVHAVAMTS